jgi:hypothetical protein
MEPSSDKPNPISIPPVGLVHEFTKQKKGLPGSPHPDKLNSDASRPLLFEAHVIWKKLDAERIGRQGSSARGHRSSKKLAGFTSSISRTGQ